MYSMTGFGRANIETGNAQIQVEIKSYNAKNLDVYMQLSSEFSSYEQEIRGEISSQFTRGKFDIRITLVADANHLILQENATQLLSTLSTQLKAIDISLQVSIRELQSLGFLVGVDGEVLKKPLFDTLKTALNDLRLFRQTEGKRHEESLRKDLQTIEKSLTLIESKHEEASISIKNRLLETISLYQLDTLANEQRLIEEVSYYVIKNSIKEEIVRLQSHITACYELFSLENAIGRRLDFVAQEMYREANTIASKSEHMEIKQASLLIKEAIDSIREQGRNIE
ncbi:YicC family protein [Entomospira entomophila]|uniref:YicC family protein n=1 Tax=Entomospira entomophila TaxID=2719988 RepID=A0A968GAF4_9SPIO|nr:YicC/YloC family endoribonuclease [Entomospira entomophilus]NIZ40765.1 YicC family protein [Entomospira entomophilus]WDI34978.1 YicC family protein [Entomospira entomophilus]